MAKPTVTAIGAYLRETRESRSLTLRDVERITEGKVSNPLLSQIETGKVKRPSMVTLFRLSAALAVPLETLAALSLEIGASPPQPDYCPHCGQIMRERP